MVHRVQKTILVHLVEQRTLTKNYKHTENCLHNRKFIDGKMLELFDLNFIERNELIAVTGILPGGANGVLKNKDGSRKDTRAIDSNECFVKQPTPYVYPLLKAHKLSIEELKNVKPDEVSQKIPARLVVGMSCCQMSRVQAWLEAFLTPLSKLYGKFEYTKDSTDILIDFQNLNEVAGKEKWNFNDLLLFGIDVQALYPSVKFDYLREALLNCFDVCTKWNNNVKSILCDMIIYTLENQQILWDNKFFMLDKGIPTGGKHCVPLANIFLSYIMRNLMIKDIEFSAMFETNLKLWKRFIDDCGGVFLGKERFGTFFSTLNRQFNQFELYLTHEISDHSIQLLDIEIFVENENFHTREFRKETASSSYVKFGSAHPKHCFKGIVKSQLLRLRRLCSRDTDFFEAVSQLRKRCENSGYSLEMVDNILQQAHTLQRNLNQNRNNDFPDVISVRWVVLAGTSYENQIERFAQRINRILSHHKIKLEIVKCTGSTLGNLLFQNNVKSSVEHSCTNRCDVCSNDLRNDNMFVESPTNGRSYPVNPNLNCIDSGIYCISCSCLSLYVGKTTTQFNQRFKEHFNQSRSSAVLEHSKSCGVGSHKFDYSVQYLENMHSRGKYSLSEREYLWNERLRGLLNIQKTLKS